MRERIYGRKPVYETLRANRRNYFKCYFAQEAKETGTLAEIAAQCRRLKIPVEHVPKQTLETIAPGNQGVVLEASDYPYVSPEDIYEAVLDDPRPGLILILDTLQDPQNFGTLLRTAEAVGVHGVFIPQRRAVGVLPSVVNASSGATEHLLISQGNLASTIKVLKKQDIWIVGLEEGEYSQPIMDAPFQQPVALVVGNEGSGLRRLVRESCDMLVSLPMQGKIESLNASVAGSVVLYIISQSRGW